jgi:ATP-dependent protease Clp ATPase subunit
MGKVAQALKRVLEEYEISQYALSVAMDVERNNVYRWVNEKRDPTGDTISLRHENVEIVRSLRGINAEAAARFVALYLRDEV